MQKQEKIVKMFNEIAPKYDVTNKVLSFGIDSRWRKKAKKEAKRLLGEKKDLLIADVACGTGDMCALLNQINNAKIIGIDPSEGMLAIAKKRLPTIEFRTGYANNLPLESESVDLLSISYGFRNVVEKEISLNEFKRVLKPNGILLVLEFFKREKNGFIGLGRDYYLKKVLPKIGGFMSKNKAAYEYLPNSIDDFYSTSEFSEKLAEYDFKIEYFKNFSFGVSSLFIATKNVSK